MMRLISQKRSYDLPYKRTIVYVGEDGEIFAESNGGDTAWMMGRYESRDRAMEVMEEMHNWFMWSGSEMYYFPEK